MWNKRREILEFAWKIYIIALLTHFPICIKFFRHGFNNYTQCRFDPNSDGPEIGHIYLSGSSPKCMKIFIMLYFRRKKMQKKMMMKIPKRSVCFKPSKNTDIRRIDLLDVENDVFLLLLLQFSIHCRGKMRTVHRCLIIVRK